MRLHQPPPKNRDETMTDDENFKKVLSKQTYEQWHKAQWEINLVPFVNRIVAESVIKEFETNARLAALDDCKTLLDDRLKEGLWDEIRGLAKARELILAELEALRKKVEK